MDRAARGQGGFSMLETLDPEYLGDTAKPEARLSDLFAFISHPALCPLPP